MGEKMDAERAAFETWYRNAWGWPEHYGFEIDCRGQYESTHPHEQWVVWQARASLPVGVPYVATLDMKNAGLRELDRQGIDPEDVELQSVWHAMYAAAPTVKAERVGMADAYVGAREDLAIWKRRALEAEQKIRHQEQIIDHLTLEAQGETRFGEPSLPSAQPVAVIEYAGYDPANSIKWLNKGLQYMEPGTLLYAQAPSMPAAGSAVEEVEVVGYRFFHVDHGYIFRRTHIYEGNPSLEAHGLMTVAQHNRIVAQLSARRDGVVGVPRDVHLRNLGMLISYVTLLASLDYPDNDEGDYQQRLNESKRAAVNSTIAELRALLASHQRGEV